MANKRIYYAVQAVAFSACGENVFTNVKGAQSCGVDTKFNLEQVFELGQISIYENIENIPDISITVEKVLDGTPLIYHLATKGSTSASLAGRSNVKSTVGLSIFSDQQDSASGTPLSQCTMSGVYPSTLNYTFQVNGNCTESVTLVGNNKVWNNTFTPTAFTNTDTPPGSGGVQRREDVMFGSGQSVLPADIPGITGQGYNIMTGEDYGAHIQSIRVSTNLGRDQLFELGRRGPYHRYVTFPVEVKTDIEVNSLQGDNITALEDGNNLTDRQITIKMREGANFNMGSKNKLASVTFAGGNAGQNGGIATDTYSYSNFNDLTVTAPHDPSGL